MQTKLENAFNAPNTSSLMLVRIMTKFVLKSSAERAAKLCSKLYSTLDAEILAFHFALINRSIDITSSYR